MISLHRAADRYRGGDLAAGIESLHALSFGHFYDPDNLRFGPVLACNEERLAPGAGFDEHPHSHTEIVTWVVEGELTHRDSTGRRTLVRPGDVQYLGAGDGVRHEERNEGPGPLVFVQMWLAPLTPGGEAAYDVARAVAARYELPGAGAVLHVARPAAGQRVPLPPHCYVHVVRGELALGARELGPGDSVRAARESGHALVAAGDAEVLVWEFAERPDR
ncbi:pirin family protein [Streptomyces sp. NPDC004111]|uniref:pirin family protein n=1 Tax=Streptomyces sp. NPDC004111 TaxID=3364690 RepID=UPI0036807706